MLLRTCILFCIFDPPPEALFRLWVHSDVLQTNKQTSIQSVSTSSHVLLLCVSHCIALRPPTGCWIIIRSAAAFPFPSNFTTDGLRGTAALTCRRDTHVAPTLLRRRGGPSGKGSGAVAGWVGASGSRGATRQTRRSAHPPPSPSNPWRWSPEANLFDRWPAGLPGWCLGGDPPQLHRWFRATSHRTHGTNTRPRPAPTGVEAFPGERAACARRRS
jgi:hypothetical protein